MHRTTKIATCCYCGARAALVLGENRQELICSNCGAPLHEMKQVPVNASSQRRTRSAPLGPPPADVVKPMREVSRKGKRKKPKKRKSTLRWIASELGDVIEDILD